MTKRTFLSTMLKAGVASMFLPGASRIWRPVNAIDHPHGCYVVDFSNGGQIVWSWNGDVGDLEQRVEDFLRMNSSIVGIVPSEHVWRSEKGEA